MTRRERALVALRRALIATVVVSVVYLALVAFFAWAPPVWFGRPGSGGTTLVVVVVLAALCVLTYRAHTRQRPGAIPGGVIAILATSSAVLALSSYLRCHDASHFPLFTALIWTIGTVRGNSGQQFLGTGSSVHPCPAIEPAALEIARTSGSFVLYVSVIAILASLFITEIDRARVRLARAVTAIVDIDNDSREMVTAVGRTVRKERRTHLALIVAENQVNAVRDLRVHGARVIAVDLDKLDRLELAPLWRKTRQLYLMSASPTTNLRRLAIIEQRLRGTAKRRLPLIVRIDDPWQAEAWRAQQLGGSNTMWAADAVGVHEVTAARLLDRIIDIGLITRIIVCGTSPLALALCAKMARRQLERNYYSPPDAFPLPAITLVANNAEEYRKDIEFHQQQLGFPPADKWLAAANGAISLASLTTLINAEKEAQKKAQKDGEAGAAEEAPVAAADGALTGAAPQTAPTAAPQGAPSSAAADGALTAAAAQTPPAAAAQTSAAQQVPTAAAQEVPAVAAQRAPAAAADGAPTVAQKVGTLLQTPAVAVKDGDPGAAKDDAAGGVAVKTAPAATANNAIEAAHNPAAAEKDAPAGAVKETQTQPATDSHAGAVNDSQATTSSAGPAAVADTGKDAGSDDEEPTVAIIFALPPGGGGADALLSTRLASRFPTLPIFALDPKTDQYQDSVPPIVGQLRTFRPVMDVPSSQGHDAWERAAMLIHERYAAEAGHGTEASKPWAELNEFYRGSNRRTVRNALWMVEKIAGHTWDSFGGVPDQPAAAPADAPTDTLTPEQVLKQTLDRLAAIGFDRDTAMAMAKAEHEDWLRYYRRAGWRYSPKRDDPHKLHPNLVSWETVKHDQKKLNTALRSVATTLYSLRELGFVSRPLWQRYRRTGTVTATRHAKPWTWTTQSGQSMRARAGDWEVRDGDGSSWSVRDRIFRSSYQHIGGNRWQAKGVYRARPARDGETIDTLEGQAVASGFDWVVEGTHGEQWVVQPDVFARHYEPVESS